MRLLSATKHFAPRLDGRGQIAHNPYIVRLLFACESSEMFVIGDRKIGKSYPPLVIAEIGINHGGDLNVAKEMVLAAAKSGCEIVKHQTHFVEDEMTEEAKTILPPNADISI